MELSTVSPEFPKFRWKGTMKEKDIQLVMNILSNWNPLRERAKLIKDLDRYRTEAMDILFHLSLCGNESNAVNIVQDVLNQAFDMSLGTKECKEAASKIWKIYFKLIR